MSILKGSCNLANEKKKGHFCERKIILQAEICIIQGEKNDANAVH